MFLYCKKCERIHAFYITESTSRTEVNVDVLTCDATENDDGGFPEDLDDGSYKTEYICPTCNKPSDHLMQYSDEVDYEDKDFVSKLFKRTIGESSETILNNIVLTKLTAKQLLKVKKIFEL
jgi:hypothetical protein